MEKLINPLITQKYTSIFHEEPAEMKYGAPHTFAVMNLEGTNGPMEQVLTTIHFQEGPIKECGVNGIANEDALAMVLTRLEHFQKTPYACRENAVAITKLEECLMWLRKRTLGREQRSVEGTNKV
jgi:hypothetical protein